MAEMEDNEFFAAVFDHRLKDLDEEKLREFALAMYKMLDGDNVLHAHRYMLMHQVQTHGHAVANPLYITKEGRERCLEGKDEWLKLINDEEPVPENRGQGTSGGFIT